MRFGKLGNIFALVLLGWMSCSFATDAPIYQAIKNHKLGIDRPLGGTFPQGTKIFKNSNGKLEAEQVFKTSGAEFMALTPWRHFFGIDHEKQKDVMKAIEEKKAKLLEVPAMTDHIQIGSRDYRAAAEKFMGEFNAAMAKLSKIP